MSGWAIRFRRSRISTHSEFSTRCFGNCWMTLYPFYPKHENQKPKRRWIPTFNPIPESPLFEIVRLSSHLSTFKRQLTTDSDRGRKASLALHRDTLFLINKTIVSYCEPSLSARAINTSATDFPSWTPAALSI